MIALRFHKSPIFLSFYPFQFHLYPFGMVLSFIFSTFSLLFSFSCPTSFLGKQMQQRFSRSRCRVFVSLAEMGLTVEAALEAVESSGVEWRGRHALCIMHALCSHHLWGSKLNSPRKPRLDPRPTAIHCSPPTGSNDIFFTIGRQFCFRVCAAAAFGPLASLIGFFRILQMCSRHTTLKLCLTSRNMA
ncbi:hypothetical protein DFH27DRAFT_272451 [Peziza echinospora]|nr:hypothetical protein DFH27DRAFT_272451 [Peziza echinospora]